ncbi:LysR family transcriptional regulator [Zymomonas sp.]|uniref:LysR family transcriptional regulator n=1 Tax=Zymomonas sp. TaxID=2068624 RepID=UPI0025FA28C0|nr:LysR family transcriptional regulator [Zymomonas sp.]MCA1956170.1 LysR family transcriptional regulator [Zymomonas sp.]
MAQENFNDLAVFTMVAHERSFTRAAAKIGVSQSALSQTIRALEERIGIQLLRRTTRSVTPTEAGTHLYRTLAPRFTEIEAKLADLIAMKDKPVGSLRITAGEHSALSILQPALNSFLPHYPDINVEIIVDYGLTDIVAQGYDAGIRIGEQVAKDMIAIKIGADMRMAIVASPAYFQKHPKPQSPHDLMAHNCINIRLPTYGGIFPWDLEKDNQKINIRVEGQLTFNNLDLRLHSALDGLGIAYLPEDTVLSHIQNGRLIRVLEDWCPLFSGYHLYYPSRKHSPALSLLIDHLRYRG